MTALSAPPTTVIVATSTRSVVELNGSHVEHVVSDSYAILPIVTVSSRVGIVQHAMKFQQTCHIADNERLREISASEGISAIKSVRFGDVFKAGFAFREKKGNNGTLG